MNSRQHPTQAQAEHYTQYTWIRCAVPEFDPAAPTFPIELADGRQIKAPATAQYSDKLLEAHNGYQSGIYIMLEGHALFDAAHQLLELKSVEGVSVLELPNVVSRLKELKSLEDGWLDGEGLAPPESCLDWLQQAFDKHYPQDLPQPFLYPTPEGGVQAEWSLGRNEVSLETDLNTHSGEWHALNMKTDASCTRVLNLEQVREWQWLAKQIRLLAQHKLAQRSQSR